MRKLPSSNNNYSLAQIKSIEEFGDANMVGVVDKVNFEDILFQNLFKEQYYKIC